MGILYRREFEVGVEFGITEDSQILRSLVLVAANVLEWI